jgi:GT2 family glycosyltransferase
VLSRMSPLETTSESRSPPRRRFLLTRLIIWGFLAPQGALAVSTGYLLALLLAARDETRSAPKPLAIGPDRLRFVVLVPAHDEESGIGATLESLELCVYPRDDRRTVVIADNCIDRTADCARRAGVEVWERFDPAHRGKGFALGWALARLQAEGDTFDAVVVLDADCVASPNLLSAIDERLRSGAHAVQVNYVAANPDDSNASALRFSGFALMNTVRFLGKQRLGLSCGLVGTGMAFTRDLLTREPWSATGIVEDAEYHLRLVQAGERSQFVPEAWVSSAVPTSLKGSSDQQARWEQGKLQLIRHWSPRLVSAGLARRDIVQIHAGLEWLVPPQSLIAAGTVGSALAGLLLGSRRLMLLSTATLTAQLIFVLEGLRLVRAPIQVYRALLLAPALIAGKVALYVRLLGGRGPTSWVRTEREAPMVSGDGR